MNIAHLIFSGSWAGSEAAAFAIASQQAKNHKVNIFVQEGKVTKRDYLKKIPNNVGLHAVSGLDSDENIIKFLSSHFKNIDIVHTHLGRATYFAKKVKKNLNSFKIISHMHMRYYSEQFDEVDGVVAVSPWQLKDIPSHFNGEYFLVPNFLNFSDLEKFSLKEIIAIKNRFFIKDNDYVFGVVSRLHIEKGVDVVIRAFRSIKADNAKLIIFGEGPELQNLKILAGNDKRIFFGGFVVGGIRYMDIFDCYVSPSRCESFGISQLEAIYRNKIVIASKTYGSMDIFKSAENLFDIDDEIQLINLMEKAFDGKLSNYVDMEDYGFEKNSEKLEEFYKIVLEKE